MAVLIHHRPMCHTWHVQCVIIIILTVVSLQVTKLTRCVVPSCDAFLPLVVLFSQLTNVTEHKQYFQGRSITIMQHNISHRC